MSKLRPYYGRGRKNKLVMTSEPVAHRPLYLEYMTVGHILRHEKSVYEMTEEEFVNSCMQHSHGGMSAFNARIIYGQLIKEAKI